MYPICTCRAMCLTSPLGQVRGRTGDQSFWLFHWGTLSSTSAVAALLQAAQTSKQSINTWAGYIQPALGYLLLVQHLGPLLAWEHLCLFLVLNHLLSEVSEHLNTHHTHTHTHTLTHFLIPFLFYFPLNFFLLSITNYIIIKCTYIISFIVSFTKNEIEEGFSCYVHPELYWGLARYWYVCFMNE